MPKKNSSPRMTHKIMEGLRMLAEGKQSESHSGEKFSSFPMTIDTSAEEKIGRAVQYMAEKFNVTHTGRMQGSKYHTRLLPNTPIPLEGEYGIDNEVIRRSIRNPSGEFNETDVARILLAEMALARQKIKRPAGRIALDTTFDPFGDQDIGF